MVDTCIHNPRVALAAPRGHAKSTVLTLFYVLWCALYKYKKFIVIVSASAESANRFLRRVRDELESNPTLKFMFDSQRSDKWSETEIRLKNGVTIMSKGRGAQMRGLINGSSRPDLIVLDDIEDDEAVRSELRRSDLEGWFNGAVKPTLDPKNGQIVFVGTVLHEDALLNRLLNPELYPDFVRHKYQAIQKDGTALWEERHSIESLNEIKKSYAARFQTARFYMEYQNNPIPEESAVFRAEYFTYFEELPKPPYTSEVYVDLGGGSMSKTADPTAIVHLLVDGDNRIFINDYINKRYGEDTKTLIDDLLDYKRRYNPSRFIIEKTVATNFLKASLEAEMLGRGIYLNIEYVTPPRGSGQSRGNMSDGKYQRIAAMQAAFKLGAIKMRKHMTELQEQLVAFPRAQHDDLADALSYGFMMAQRFPQEALRSAPDTYEPLYPSVGI